MKFLQRYCSVLLLLVMCVGLFSVTASAELVEMDTSHIFIQSFCTLDSSQSGEIITYPFNGIVEGKTVIFEDLDTTKRIGTVYREHYISTDNGNVLFVAGKPVKFWLNNMVVSNLVMGANSSRYFNEITNVSLYVTYKSGLIEYQEVSVEYGSANNLYNLKLEFTPSEDVQQMTVTLSTTIPKNVLNETSVDIHAYIGELDNKSFGMQYEVETDETQELKGIRAILEKVKNGIDNVVTAVTELPGKIADSIGEKIKELFVPNEQEMVEYKDKWEELLESRFGAVYQVVNIVTDSWNGVINADETDTITFPSATLNFGGTSFTFGGYDVQIVPDGFGVLTTAIKSIVAIVCTIAFINGLRKRYDEVMGVET